MRTPVLVFIVVPLSFLQRQRVAVRRRFRRWQLGAVTDSKAAAVAAERHEANVSAVQSQLQAWNEKGRPCRLRTARPNWASMSLKLGSNKGECHLIETGHMNEILSVNAEDLTLVAEPGVTMGELTDVLLPMNLALQTHVEMESITLGGVAMGFGIETNSHRYGFFQESVLAYELLDSHGVRRQVTADSDPELFYALPWSHGTLGFLTCLTVRLVRTKPFIRMVYEPTYSAEQLTARLTELAARPWETPATGKSSGRRGSRRAIASVDSAADDARAPDFVEATMYDKDRAVIQAGWYVDGPPAGVKPSKINSFWKTFFFRHVETFLEKGTTEEFIPLKHFLHRFTRSIFWEIEDMIPFSNHPLYRCLWGWLGPPEVSLLKLFQGPVIRRASVYAHAVQESIMPIKHLTQGIEHFDEWFGAYPLLVFPVRLFSRGALSGFVNPRADECHDEHGSTRSGLWVDLGVYGAPRLVKAGLVWDAHPHPHPRPHPHPHPHANQACRVSSRLAWSGTPSRQCARWSTGRATWAGSRRCIRTSSALRTSFARCSTSRCSMLHAPGSIARMR